MLIEQFNGHFTAPLIPQLRNPTVAKCSVTCSKLQLWQTDINRSLGEGLRSRIPIESEPEFSRRGNPSTR